jgi:hypothetical protein
MIAADDFLAEQRLDPADVRRARLARREAAADRGRLQPEAPRIAARVRRDATRRPPALAVSTGAHPLPHGAREVSGPCRSSIDP